MDKELIDKIKEINIINIQPNDIVIIKLRNDCNMSQEQGLKLIDKAKKELELPDTVKIVMVDGGDIEIIRKETDINNIANEIMKRLDRAGVKT